LEVNNKLLILAMSNQLKQTEVSVFDIANIIDNQQLVLVELEQCRLELKQVLGAL